MGDEPMDIDRRSLPYHGGRGILTTYRERERYPQDNLDASLKKLTFREQKLPEVDPRLLSTEESKEMVTTATHRYFDNVMEGLDEFKKQAKADSLTRKQLESGKMSLIYESETERPKIKRARRKKANINDNTGHGNAGKPEDGVLGRLNESSFPLPATTGEGLSNKRKAEDAVSDNDMEDGEIKDVEDHEEKSDVKDGKPAGKKAKVENPYLVHRPFAPAKNTKPRDPNRVAILKQKLKFQKGVKPREMHERIRIMSKIKNLVGRVIEGHETNADVEKIHADLRKEIHKLEHYDWINPDLLELTNVQDEGLRPLVSSRDGVFPADIVDDASVILNRWNSGELEGSLIRGVNVLQGKAEIKGKVRKGVSYTIEDNYAHRIPAGFGGSNGLVNGQWWPLQVCAQRDGAHGERQAGISGVKGRGAQSIILAGSGYKDIDNGDEIMYCGTSGAKGQPTEATKLMNESWKLSTPIRVLRSASLPKKNKYRPAEGIRYDGLYDVVDAEKADEGTAMYRFKLKRCAHQGPIRFEGPTMRPTEEDLCELRRAFRS